MIDTLKEIFTRDLNRLRKEIQDYKDESNLWKTEHSIANSAGNLCLHLIGNLNTYIGKEIGKSGYLRDRDAEFALKNISREEILINIDETIHAVSKALDRVDDKNIKNEFPALVFDKKTSIEYMLIHLTTHLSYHLGQINYHRRFIDN